MEQRVQAQVPEEKNGLYYLNEYQGRNKQERRFIRKAKVEEARGYINPFPSLTPHTELEEHSGTDGEERDEETRRRNIEMYHMRPAGE
jgi:hypothetical protein